MKSFGLYQTYASSASDEPLSEKKFERLDSFEPADDTVAGNMILLVCEHARLHNDYTYAPDTPLPYGMKVKDGVTTIYVRKLPNPLQNILYAFMKTVEGRGAE